MFLYQRRAFHRTYPATYSEFALQTSFVEFYGFQRFRVLTTDGRNSRRKAVNCYHTFRRSDGRQRLNQTPRRIRHNRSPLRMKIRTRTVRSQLQKLDALETETDYRAF